MSSAKWRPFCLGLNVLKDTLIYTMASHDQQNVNISLSKSEIYLYIFTSISIETRYIYAYYLRT